MDTGVTGAVLDLDLPEEVGVGLARRQASTMSNGATAGNLAYQTWIGMVSDTGGLPDMEVP